MENEEAIALKAVIELESTSFSSSSDSLLAEDVKSSENTLSEEVWKWIKKYIFPNSPRRINLEGLREEDYRVNSLDQFTGWVILSSFIVPVLGSMSGSSAFFRHVYTWITLNDVTLSQFWFVIGFAMQLTAIRLRNSVNSKNTHSKMYLFGLIDPGFLQVIKKQLWRSLTLWMFQIVLKGIDGYDSYHDTDGLKEWWYLLPLLPFYDRDIYSTLGIIAVSQLFVLPVITRSKRVRACYAVGCAVLYTMLQFLFLWNMSLFNPPPPSRDSFVGGGLLGGLSGAVMMIIGTFMNDWLKWIREIRPTSMRHIIKGSVLLVISSLILFGLSTAISALPQQWCSDCLRRYSGDDEPVGKVHCDSGSFPGFIFVPKPLSAKISIWTQSQYSLNISYSVGASGYSILIYLIWFWITEVGKYQWLVLSVLRKHSLIMYVARELGFRISYKIIPHDSPLGFLVFRLIISLSVNMMIVFYLERNRIYFRL